MKPELTTGEIDDGQQPIRLIRVECACGAAVEAEPADQGPLSAATYGRYLSLLERQAARQLREHRCPLS